MRFAKTLKLAALLLTGGSLAAVNAAIGFVQSNYAVPATAQTSVTVTYNAAQTVGNLNVVVVGWADTTATVGTVTDSRGNVYQRAVGPTLRAGIASQSIYYAKNIAAAAAGANVVTVTFSVAAQFPDVRILEYSGIDAVNPLDVTVGANGSNATSSSGAVTTTNANDLLIGANVVATSTRAAGANFTQRILTNPNGDLVEDRIVTATGSYSATAALTSAGGWVMQMAAFRASTAPPPPDTTAPTVPGTLTASAASSSQINLSWTASSDPDSPTITYHVERCQGVGCANFAEVATPTATALSDTGRNPSTSYSYRVRASDPSNNFSAYSNTATAVTQAGSVTPTYVQSNYAVPSTPQNVVSVLYSGAQTGGNLNVVVVGWADTTALVASVTDTSGNTYQLAVGPTQQSAGASQSIYYAKNILAANAGTNSVKVTFTTAATFPDIRIAEYSGIDPVNPVDGAAGASGSNGTSSSGALATTNATDLLVAANDVTTSTTGPGAGFTQRALTPDGDILEDQVVTATGSYTATAPLSAAGGWVMQMVAFRAAGGTPPPPDTTAPTVPTNAAAQGLNGTQISVSWTASSDPDSPNITYHVERCQGTGCSTFAEVGAVTVTSYTDSGLTTNASYSYRVRASDPSNNFSGYSNTTTATPPGPDPTISGQWSAPFNWPSLGIHMTLMPNGKILTWEDENASPAAQVLDPATLAFTPVPYTAFDLFCAGHTVLPDGRIMVAGGHNGANYNGLKALTFFNPATQTWTAGPNMSFPRWYPTVTALPDGRQLVTSGAMTCENCNANTPEIYDPAANTWTKLTAATINLPIYPHMFVLPDGRVIVTGSYELPVVTQALNLATQTWTTIDPAPYDAGSAAMYLPGKILKSGTSANSDPPYTNAVNNAYVLDMTQPSPAWRPTNPMTYARSYHNTTILPDGNVLVTGGESYTDVYNLANATETAEMWSPVTEKWTVMASAQVPRVYHSTAILLPDGRVLTAGGGEYGPGSISQLNGEIYSPPYLFHGARPTITSAPATIQYGQAFTVQTPDAASIASIALMRLGSVTHAFDENQRYVPLSFTVGTGSLAVTAPANVNIAPPGHYMLFILNGSGVPSVAPIMSLPVPAGTGAPTAPGSLTPQVSTGKVVLTWTASTSPRGIANYNVYRSTTAGFTPSAATRIASPGATTYTDTAFTASATYYYLVTAVDATAVESAPSNQALASVTADTTPPTVSMTAPAAGAVVSGNVALTANASDNVVVTGVQFQVDGVNLGAPVTTAPYSASWSSTGAPNGSHSLRAIATDGANLSTTSAAVNVTVSNTAPAQITFVQGNYAVPATPQSTVPVGFTGAQTAGNLIVVAIGWNNSTGIINSVTDSKGNVYAPATATATIPGVQSLAIYYARNIAAAAAGTNFVTVTFNTAVPYPDVRVLEYSGLDTINPLDVTASATGNSGASSSGAMTTTNANDLLFAANYVATSTAGAGAGFTSRMITNPDGDIAEDQIVAAVGSYTATANLTSAGNWIMQMVAFRAAGSAPMAPLAVSPK